MKTHWMAINRSSWNSSNAVEHSLCPLYSYEHLAKEDLPFSLFSFSICYFCKLDQRVFIKYTDVSFLVMKDAFHSRWYRFTTSLRRQTSSRLIMAIEISRHRAHSPLFSLRTEVFAPEVHALRSRGSCSEDRNDSHRYWGCTAMCGEYILSFGQAANNG